jgi:DNA polymerase-3 subunit delta'
VRRDAALSLLKEAFRRDRLAHAHLLGGAPRGAAGELAVALVQLVVCGRPDAPCGACDACRQVRERTRPDIVWIEPEKKSRAISIDQIREVLLPLVQQTAFLSGGWKAAVLLAADRMTEPAANCFLKTLEEPPAKTLFLLVTDRVSSLPATVVSRCQPLDVTDDEPPDLPEPWRSQVREVLAGPAWSGPTAAMAAAERLLAVLGDMRDRAEKEVGAEAGASLVEEDSDAIKGKTSSRYREYRSALLQALSAWFHDLLLLRAGGSAEMLRHREHAAVLAARAAKLTLAQALRNIEGIEDLNRQLERNIPERNLLAYWLDRLYTGG